MSPLAARSSWPTRRADSGDYDAMMSVLRNAHAHMRMMRGLAPSPLLVDYRKALLEREVWLALGVEASRYPIAGVLILQPCPGHMVIESLATHPSVSGRGVGTVLLETAEAETLARGLRVVRIRMGASLESTIEWCHRRDFVTERIDELGEFPLVYLKKQLSPCPPVLLAGDRMLRRATADDYDRLVALQHAAYARNRVLLGVEPIPLKADYHAVLREKEVWLAQDSDHLLGALILEPRADDLMIESIATDPARQAHGLGRALLAAAEARAQQMGYRLIRLYTGTVLTHLTSWYARHGFETERIEVLSDRSITHMMKSLSA